MNFTLYSFFLFLPEQSGRADVKVTKVALETTLPRAGVVDGEVDGVLTGVTGASGIGHCWPRQTPA